MDVQVEEHGACRKTLTIEIAAAEVQAEVDSAVREFAKHANIPGYRKGRAPSPVVRRKYQKEIDEHVRERLVPKGYQDAIRSQEFEVAAVVGASDPEWSPGEAMRFKVTLDTAPTFELPSYKGVSLKRDTVVVEEAAVESAIRDFLSEKETQFETRAEGEAVRAKDVVQIDYEGVVDGRPAAELDLEVPTMGAGQGEWTQAGPEALIPEIGEALVGLHAGEGGEVEVAFDEEHREEALRGRTATYTFKVLSAMGMTVPELDDEIAEKAGYGSAGEMRAKVREDLEAMVAKREEQNLRGKLVQAVVEPLQFAIPESVLERETQNEIYQQVNRLNRQGVDQALLKEKKDELFQAANQLAKQRLKTGYILDRIAAAEGIEASDADLDARVVALGREVGLDPVAMREVLVKNESLDRVRRELLHEKTIDFLMEHAQIRD